jgi:hypothetical protein
MANDDDQKEMVRLLQQAVEELRKNRESREAIQKDAVRFDFKKSREESERRIQEARKEMEVHRKQDQEYHNRLLGTLDRLIDVLSRVEGKLENLR